MLVVRWIPLVAFITSMGLWLTPLTAMGRDLDGRYANSPLKSWFDQLKSGNGPCCSNADGAGTVGQTIPSTRSYPPLRSLLLVASDLKDGSQVAKSAIIGNTADLSAA